MRLCFVFCFVALCTLSPARAGEEPTPCAGKTITQCIANAPLSPGKNFERQIHFDGDEYDVKSLKTKTWFKSTVVVYWLGAAVKAYLDDGEFRFSDRVLRENKVSAPFGEIESSRIVFVPRSVPFIILPLGRQSAEDHAWTFHITSRGGAISFAINPGHPRRKH